MTGKVIDSGANSLLLVILPLALAIVIVFVAWPLILGIFALVLAWKLWQTYQWQKLSGEIDPLFNQLVQAHQGCLTVLDLSMKTSLNANTAKWYLDRKADQYGAIKRLYEDKGVVYYFLTAGALGSIFDDSDPYSDTEELAPLNNLSSSSSDTSKVSSESKQQSSQTEIASSATQISATTNESTQLNQETKELDESIIFSSSYSTSKIDQDLTSENQPNNLMLNQADLAKRLEVHSSTIGKRKSEEDFGLWSQSRDPDGIPWQYLEEEKMFIPLESS